jgi:hypothetical protein
MYTLCMSAPAATSLSFMRVKSAPACNAEHGKLGSIHVENGVFGDAN